MITTLEQLLLNHTAISKDGKLYSEWHVKQAYNLATAQQAERVKELEEAIMKMISEPEGHIGNIRYIGKNALNKS